MSTPPLVPPRGGPQPSPIQTTPPAVSFQTNNVAPSQYVYLQSKDVIGLNIITNTPGLPITLSYRFLTPQGEVKEGSQTFPTVTTLNSFTVPLGECWLLSATLRLSSFTSPGQWIFAQITIGRTIAGSTLTNSLGFIWEGYVRDAGPTGWPGDPSERINEGPGVLRSILGTTPAAGAELFQAGTAGQKWLIQSITFTLTTSATVANRNVTLVVDDGGLILYQSPSFLNQTAGTTTRYATASQLQTGAQLAGAILIPFPFPLPFQRSWRFRTITTGLQAADQYTAPQINALEWGTLNSQGE